MARGQGRPEPRVNRRLYDVKPHFREALAYRAIFRRLGFAEESVVFTVTRREGLSIIQMVLKNGIKEFVCNIDRVRAPLEALEHGWAEARTCWEDASDEERALILRRSFVVRNADEFLVGLIRKGFEIDLVKL